MSINSHHIEAVLKTKKFKIVGHALLPRVGWETDNHVALVRLEGNGQLKLVCTSHGKPYIMEERALREHRDECLSAVSEMTTLLRMIEEEKTK